MMNLVILLLIFLSLLSLEYLPHYLLFQMVAISEDEDLISGLFERSLLIQIIYIYLSRGFLGRFKAYKEYHVICYLDLPWIRE